MPFTDTDAEQIALKHYALPAIATSLPGELDANFLLTTTDGAQYILKIAHPSRSVELLDMENQMMAHLDGKQTPRVIPSRAGETIATLAGGNYARLLTYLSGEVLARVPHTPTLLHNFGVFLGDVDHHLQNFTHAAMKRDLLWDLTRSGDMIRKYGQGLANPHPSTALDTGNAANRTSSSSAQDASVLLSDMQHQSLLTHFLHRFERYVSPYLPHLPWQVIHNDANDYNVLVENDQISGLLDFGDAIYNPRICELAIAIAYAILGKDDPLSTATLVVQGYHSANPLTQDEIAMLWDLIGARLAVSVAVSSHRAIAEPENEYLQVSAQPARRTINRIVKIEPDAARSSFFKACSSDSS